MQQEINLYHLLPKKTGFDLTRSKVLWSYGLFILLLFILHFMGTWQKHKLNAQLDKLNSEAALTQQQLSTLTQQYPIIDPVALKKAILDLQTDYENKAKNIDLLSPDANFSAYLLGLGKAIVSGVWLTEIGFDRGEIKIALRGYALHPVLLEQFYTELTHQPVYSDLEFKLNEVKQARFPASFFITATKVNKP